MANIQNIRANNEPQKAYMWEVQIKGGNVDTLSDLDAYAKTVSIPQTSVEQLVINHKATKSHYAGRDASGHTVQVTFWDDQSLTIYKYFQDWMNIILDQETGSGASRDLYAADMVIKLKDDADQAVTGAVTLTKSFPTDIGDVSLSYETSEAVEVSVTLSFDGKFVE